MNRLTLAQYLDHTLLKPDATRQDIVNLVKEGQEWQTYAVCINSGWVKTAVQARDNHSNLHIASTIGFPFGQAGTPAKVAEVRYAINEGADEIDVVWNLGMILSGDIAAAEDDLAKVINAAGNIPVKVILETARLTPEQMTQGAQIAVRTGAHTVKTSTGFGFSGAKREAVAILRQAVGKNVGVNASGGIKTYQDAINLIEAGATRLGLSGTIRVLSEAPQN